MNEMDIEGYRSKAAEMCSGCECCAECAGYIRHAACAVAMGFVAVCGNVDTQLEADMEAMLETMEQREKPMAAWWREE